MGCASSSAGSTTVAPRGAAATSSSPHLKGARNNAVGPPVTAAAIPVARGHTAQQCALHQLFSKHDRRRRNAIESSDLASMLIDCCMTEASLKSRRQAAPSQRDINRIMRFIDSDGSQALDRGEFLEWIESGMGKPSESLDKFGAQGRTETLLVEFLRGVITQTQAWAGALNEIFAREDALAPDELWALLERRGRSKANSFSKGGGRRGPTPPLLEAMVATSAADGEREGMEVAGKIQRQHVVDFMVHMSLHSNYRPHAVSRLQRDVYRMLVSAVEASLLKTKSQMGNVADSPLVVLACSAMFSTYDESGDDVLDEPELRRLLSTVCADQSTGAPPSRGDIANLMRALDVDGDGMLSRDEFVQAVLRMVSNSSGGDNNNNNASAEPPPALAVPLEIAVVGLARQLERRRTTLHRLHKRYSVKGSNPPVVDPDGISRLLRHCQRKQRVERQGNPTASDGPLVKVTESAVAAVVAAVGNALASAGAAVQRDADGGILVPGPVFSGPLLMTSCMHPRQLQAQRLESRQMGLVLDMYGMINDEVGRMVQEGEERRAQRRDGKRKTQEQQPGGRGRGGSGGGGGFSREKSLNTLALDGWDDSDSQGEDSDDSDNFPSGKRSKVRPASGSVDFGW